jgi:hypothetical protein
MSTETKVTPEELEQLKAFEINFTKAVYDLGQIHLQKYMVEKQLKSIENETKIAEQHIETLSKSEKEFSDSLIQKYGGTSVDLETGIIVSQ